MQSLQFVLNSCNRARSKPLRQKHLRGVRALQTLARSSIYSKRRPKPLQLSLLLEISSQDSGSGQGWPRVIPRLSKNCDGMLRTQRSLLRRSLRRRPSRCPIPTRFLRPWHLRSGPLHGLITRCTAHDTTLRTLATNGHSWNRSWGPDVVFCTGPKHAREHYCYTTRSKPLRQKQLRV